MIRFISMIAGLVLVPTVVLGLLGLLAGNTAGIIGVATGMILGIAIAIAILRGVNVQ